MRGTVALALLLGICLGAVASEEPVRVLATTTIVGDVVRVVAGDRVALRVLLPTDADPHAFQPTPADAAAIADADLIVLSGAGLEEELEALLRGATGRLVDLSERVALRPVSSAGVEGEDRHHGWDPHVWFDPTNVMVWASSLEAALGELDPENSQVYSANAAAYREALGSLDLWIWDQVARVPRAKRRLVSDHRSFDYFAARYGFEVVGTVFPGRSTLAEPSAQEMARLIEGIRALEVAAIFVGTTANPALAEAIAADTGTAVVRLYTGSLSDESGPAATYLEMMRHNVTAIVEALAR
ncbi:MAG: zinc ABC transporter substrate-binding protein [Candidatus Bipolaricaulota bacterium]|nr:MAG: zinc ABC transporter substrate-binding protein [Candidatus Bipolaricaulota bacterium]